MTVLLVLWLALVATIWLIWLVVLVLVSGRVWRSPLGRFVERWWLRPARATTTEEVKNNV